MASLLCVLGTRPRRPATFPQFSKLPAEMQYMIWEECLPNRVVVFTSTISQARFRPQRVTSRQQPPIISRVCRSARYVALRSVMGITFYGGRGIEELYIMSPEQAAPGAAWNVDKGDLYVAHRLPVLTSIPKHDEFGYFRALPTRVGNVGTHRMTIQTWYDKKRDTLFLRDRAHAQLFYWRDRLDDMFDVSHQAAFDYWSLQASPRSDSRLSTLRRSHQCTRFTSSIRSLDCIRIAGESKLRSTICLREPIYWTGFDNPYVNTATASYLQYAISSRLQSRRPILPMGKAYSIVAPRSAIIASGLFGLWAENRVIMVEVDDQKKLQALAKLDRMQCDESRPFAAAQEALRKHLLRIYRCTAHHKQNHPPGSASCWSCPYLLDRPCPYIDANKMQEVLDVIPLMRPAYVFQVDFETECEVHRTEVVIQSLSLAITCLFVLGGLSKILSSVLR